MMDSYGLGEPGTPVYLSVPLSLCLLCVSLHFSPRLSLFVSVCLSLWHSECVGVGLSLCLASPGLFLSFSLFICFCLCPSVCLYFCPSVSPCLCLLNCFFWLICFLLSLLLCANDQTWLPHATLTALSDFLPNRDWPPTLNPNSKFLGKRIRLAHFDSSVNFWFNSSVARKAWSWGREASDAIKMQATDKQIMKVLANGKEKEEERLWKKDKMLTTQKYYKHLTRNTSRIKQRRRAGQNYCVKGQPSKSVSFLYTSDNQLANLIFK